MATEVEIVEQAAERHPARLKRRPATVEEFRALPESILLTEYINGEIIMSPAPTPLHHFISGSVFSALSAFVRGTSLWHVFYSPLDVVLPGGDVVQPDVFLVTRKEFNRAMADKSVHAVPSLLVEILSPGSIVHDTLTKRELYERSGVREYWVVDPEARTIAQLILRKKHYVLTELSEGDTIRSVVMQGFEMKVGELLGAQ